MLMPCTPALYGQCERRRDNLNCAPRMGDDPLSLMQPTGFSVAEDAVLDIFIVHTASLRAVNFWSDSSLILVKSRSTQDFQASTSRSVRAV